MENSETAQISDGPSSLQIAILWLFWSPCLMFSSMAAMIGARNAHPTFFTSTLFATVLACASVLVGACSLFFIVGAVQCTSDVPADGEGDCQVNGTDDVHL